MLPGLAVLLLFQLVGEVLSRAFALPVPGPVIGMVLLLGALELRAPLQEPVRSTSGGLLGILSLLFVPAGVGIVQHLSRLAAEWRALSAALLVSTAATLVVTGWVAARLMGRAASPRRAGR